MGGGIYNACACYPWALDDLTLALVCIRTFLAYVCVHMCVYIYICDDPFCPTPKTKKKGEKGLSPDGL